MHCPHPGGDYPSRAKTGRHNADRRLGLRCTPAFNGGRRKQRRRSLASDPYRRPPWHDDPPRTSHRWTTNAGHIRCNRREELLPVFVLIAAQWLPVPTGRQGSIWAKFSASPTATEKPPGLSTDGRRRLRSPAGASGWRRHRSTGFPLPSRCRRRGPLLGLGCRRMSFGRARLLLPWPI